MISGFLDVSMSPKTNLIYLWRYQDTSNDLRKAPNHFRRNMLLENLRMSETMSWQCWKRRAPGNLEDPVDIYFVWEYWIWDQYLPENMKWNFGKVGSISPKNITWMVFDVWNVGTANLLNFENKKPKTQETKHQEPNTKQEAKNQQNKKTRNQEVLFIWTESRCPARYRLPPLHQPPKMLWWQVIKNTASLRETCRIS